MSVVLENSKAIHGFQLFMSIEHNRAAFDETEQIYKKIVMSYINSSSSSRDFLPALVQFLTSANFQIETRNRPTEFAANEN